MEIDEELSELILKQSLGILNHNERRTAQFRLSHYLLQEGFSEEASLIMKSNKTEDEKKQIIAAINKVFPCSE